MENQYNIGDVFVVTNNFRYDDLFFREGMTGEVRVLDEYPNSCRYGTHWLLNDIEREQYYRHLHTLNHVDPETNRYVERSSERACGWWIPWNIIHENTQLMGTDPDWEV